MPGPLVGFVSQDSNDVCTTEALGHLDPGELTVCPCAGQNFC